MGEWANGIREGHCAGYKDGIKVFEGEYRYGKMHGKCCKIYYKDGSIHFEGEFEDGLRHGEGTEYAKDGTVRRFGIWDYGMLF